MTVISDNSPLSALAEVGLLDLLHKLFNQIVIPASVAREACHPGAPAALRKWIGSPPHWVLILEDPKMLLPETSPLGAGEAAAITLAWKKKEESLLILDDLLAREVSSTLSLAYTGTAGCLLQAANAGLIDFHDAIARLEKTSFRLSPRIVEALKKKLK